MRSGPSSALRRGNQSASRPMRSGQGGALRPGYQSAATDRCGLGRAARCGIGYSSAARLTRSVQGGALRRGCQSSVRCQTEAVWAERRAAAEAPVGCQTDAVTTERRGEGDHQSAARPTLSRQSGTLRRGRQPAARPMRSRQSGAREGAATSQLPDRGAVWAWQRAEAQPSVSCQTDRCGLGRAERLGAATPHQSAATMMRSGQSSTLRRSHKSAVRPMQSWPSGARRRQPVCCQADVIWAGRHAAQGTATSQSAARPMRSRRSGALKRGHLSSSAARPMRSRGRPQKIL